MDNIKDILSSVVQKIVQTKADQRKTLENIFEASLKGEENKNVKLEGQKEDVLFVKVGSSAWLYQMNTRKNAILKNLQEDFPEIKDIRFNIGNING